MTEATVIIKGRNELSAAVKSAERSLQSLNRQGELLAKLFRGGAIAGAFYALDRLAKGAEKTAKSFGDASAALADFNRKADSATAAAKRLGAALLEESLGELGFGGVSREITELERKLDSARKRYAAFTSGGVTGFLATERDIAQAAAAIERYEQALGRLRNNLPYGERDRAPGSRGGGRSVVLQDLPKAAGTARQADEELWVLTDDTILAMRAWNDLGETSAAAMDQIGRDLSALNQEALDNLVAPLEIAKSEWSVFAEEAGRQMQNQFAQFLFDPFDEGIKGMLKGFTDMLRQMLAQLAAQELLRAFFSWGAGLGGGIGNFFSSLGGSFGGARAGGGSVAAGRSYLVGESGPELFVPGMSGSIIPNGAGGLVLAPVYNIDARGATQDLVKALPAILEESNRRAVAMAKSEIRGDIRRYGRIR